MRGERGRSPQPSGVEPGGGPSIGTGGYDASSIQVLEWPEPVRRRPAMYVGDVSSPTAVAEWAWLALGNSVALHLDRRVRSVSIAVDGTGQVEIADDGPGCSAVPDERGTTALGVLTSRLFGGWGGLRWWPGGLPWPCVNALSTRFEVESHHEGRLARTAYEHGHLVDPPAIVGGTSRSGLRVRFQADPAIFTTPALDLPHLESRLRDLAWLAPLLEVRWQGKSLPGRGGLPTLVSANGAKDLVHATHVSERFHIDLAFGWSDDGAPPVGSSFRGFAPDRDRVAEAGLWDGLLAAARRDRPALSESLVRELLSPGLRFAIHANHEPDGCAGRNQLIERRLIAKLTRDRLCYAGRLGHFGLRRRLESASARP